jgi:3-oxoacyl-(acyl-carrier-protein) synthase
VPGGVISSATGEPAGDAAEAEAIAWAVGRRAGVTAARGSLGDALAAGPALDLALAVAALESGALPPLPELVEPVGPARELDLVRAAPRPLAKKQVALVAGGVASVAAACLVAHPEAPG